MPGLDGIETTKQSMQWELDCSRPPLVIIAVTGNAFTKDRERCFSVGMNDFLTKPFSLANIVGLLLKCVPNA